MNIIITTDDEEVIACLNDDDDLVILKDGYKAYRDDNPKFLDVIGLNNSFIYYSDGESPVIIRDKIF